MKGPRGKQRDEDHDHRVQTDAVTHEFGRAMVTPPNVVFDDELSIDAGDRRIEHCGVFFGCQNSLLARQREM